MCVTRMRLLIIHFKLESEIQIFINVSKYYPNNTFFNSNIFHSINFQNYIKITNIFLKVDIIFFLEFSQVLSRV